MNNISKLNAGNRQSLEERTAKTIVAFFAVAIGLIVLAVLAIPAILTCTLKDLRWLVAYPGLLLAFAAWVAACRHK